MLFSYLGDCHNPLGMETGDIPDSFITATVPGYGGDLTLFGAHRARLNSASGYRADPKALSRARKESFSPTLLVKLPKEMVVTGIATQGRLSALVMFLNTCSVSVKRMSLLSSGKLYVDHGLLG